MDTPHDVCSALADETASFRSTFENGQWHWTYHDRRGRLLARGADCRERWAAHRALLAAIADYCTGGGAVEDDEEDPPAADEEPPFDWP